MMDTTFPEAMARDDKFFTGLYYFEIIKIDNILLQ